MLNFPRAVRPVKMHYNLFFEHTNLFYVSSRSRVMDEESSIHHYVCDRISYRSVRVQKVRTVSSPMHITPWITHAQPTLAQPVSVQIQWIQIVIQWWKHAMPIWIQQSVVAQVVRRIHSTIMVSQRSIAIKCCQIHISSTAINIFGPSNVHRWQIIS